jgi:LuxR family maltose regulon positive regulatory protein
MILPGIDRGLAAPLSASFPSLASSKRDDLTVRHRRCEGVGKLRYCRDVYGRVVVSRGRRRHSPIPPFELDESKLTAPVARPGIVSRTALVDRLTAARHPVVCITAPAGYGKTTLMSQWAQRKRSRVAWLSADDRDNDPAVLLTYLAFALDRVEPLDPRVFRALGSLGVGIGDLWRLMSSLAAMTRPVHIVLDNADALTGRECRDMVTELAVRVPAGTQLVVAAREPTPGRLSELRANGALLEIGAGDLAMDEQEGQSLLAGAGVELAPTETRALVRRTEGWPVGLYLAALAINAGSPQVDVGSRFAGNDRYMGDYLRSEFLGRVSRADVAFLTRTSILDELTGPLCDATVGRKGSAGVLDRLERRNLLVIPLDRTGEWYRYHQLFRELLHAELQRREPEMVAELHLRAAAWYEANRLPETAIGHAQQAGDGDRVARLVLEVANPVWSGGRVDTVLRWMEWFSSNHLVERHPAVAAHGALIYALVGRPAEADQWAAAAERVAPVGTVTDGNTMEGSLAYLRALLCRSGLEEMRHDADVALRGLHRSSPYRPAMLHAVAVIELLFGDLDQAELSFLQAEEEATSGNVAPFVPLLMAERGLVAIARDDWKQARTLATQALARMADGQFDDYWTSALVYAWAAQVAVHYGEVPRARELASRAARLRPLLTYALPVVSVQALLELARTYLALADPPGALAALRQIDDIRRHRRDLGALATQAKELRSRLEVLQDEMLGASSLTTAELRLLPLLATHLSLAEISERLVVSRNTVKTQAISIYRKLGVSTRSETIKRIQQVGLVAFT